MTNWVDRVNAANVIDRTAFDHDMYGVEVEVEYNATKDDIPRAVSEFWSCVHDGSLRSHGKSGDLAAEFRYTKPLNNYTSALAVKMLCTALTTTANTIYNSGRASTHVHVNVLNIPKIQVMNLITLSIIFDEFLVAQHHPFRSGNLFALRFVDAEWPIRYLTHSLMHGTNLRNFSNGNYKYASVNLTSIGKYGTIEYRSMDGEINHQRINQWVYCLHNLKRLATKYKNPREIVEKFHKMGAMPFIREHIPAYYALNLPTSKAIEMLTRGIILASDLAYSCDWVSVVDDPVVKKSQYDAYKQAIAAQAQEQLQAAQMVHGSQWSVLSAPSSSNSILINTIGSSGGWPNLTQAAEDFLDVEHMIQEDDD